MTLKTRITIAVVTAILLVTATLLVFGELVENSVEERFQDASINGKAILWKKIIASEAERMGANTSSIARDRETLKALKDKNTELLAENAITSYNMLSTGGILTKLQIYNLEGKILFSAPDNFEGYTSKNLPTLALKAGKIMSGIERDDDTKLYVNFAFPVYVRGKPAGVVLYMHDLQSAIEDFKLNDQSDVFILSAEGDVESVTDKNLLAQLDIELPILGSESISVAKRGDQFYSVVVQPLMDVNGFALAHLISAKDQTESYHAQQNLTLFSYLLIIIVVLLSIIGIIWYLFKSFQPLDTVVKIMNRISQGDLSGRIDEVNRNDEIGQLINAMSSMTDNLRRIVNEVYIATDNIGQASHDITTGIDNLSQRTITHASSLEETAASMEEMTSAVKQNANSSGTANQLANTAHEDAKKGGQVVARTVESMDEINQSSIQIADIITTINDIAFQTNLLALNAAVEAARAGEQGRGFAVVANEVRTLAQRCADAAKEIRELIDDSVEKVKAGSAHANESGQTLTGIVKGIEEVAKIVAQINTASQEQSSGIDQVNNAVIQMDNVTQQNAAMVEESAAASESLHAEATRLTGLMEFFTLRKNAGEPTKDVRIKSVGQEFSGKLIGDKSG